MKKIMERVKPGVAKTGAVLVGGLVLATASAQTQGGFAPDSLDMVEAVVNGIVTVGVTVTIALAVYSLGKRSVNRA